MKKAAAMICMTVIMLTSVMPVSASSVTDAQKAEYYKKYQNIIQALSKEAGLEIGLLPASEFAEEDWRSPEEFEEIVRQLIEANSVLCENEDGELYVAEKSTVPFSKSKRFTNDSLNYTVKISASFATQLYRNRQFISAVSSIKSEKTSGIGTWTPIGSDYALIDSARTAQVTVSGRISYAGAYVTKLVTAEFYCNACGKIS